MKAIRVRILVAALAVLFGTAIAKSQAVDVAPPPPPPMHGEFGFGGHMLQFFTDYLSLTDAQQTQIKAVMQKEHAAMKPLMQQLHQGDQQLRQYEEGVYDDVKVRALATQQSQTQIELTVQKTRIHNELFQLLTADQQTKLKEFEAKHEARMRAHMNSAPPAPPEE
jgi:Spy/CpxP family protein refolding chaperone